MCMYKLEDLPQFLVIALIDLLVWQQRQQTMIDLYQVLIVKLSSSFLLSCSITCFLFMYTLLYLFFDFSNKLTTLCFFQTLDHSTPGRSFTRLYPLSEQHPTTCFRVAATFLFNDPQYGAILVQTHRDTELLPAGRQLWQQILAQIVQSRGLVYAYIDNSE